MQSGPPRTEEQMLQAMQFDHSMFSIKSKACIRLFDEYRRSRHFSMVHSAGILQDCIHLAAKTQTEKDIATTEMTSHSIFKFRAKSCYELYEKFFSSNIPQIERWGIEGYPPGLKKSMEYLDTCLRTAAKK